MNSNKLDNAEKGKTPDNKKTPAAPQPPKEIAKEIGGREGPDPTRYGDWENNGRCTDF